MLNDVCCMRLVPFGLGICVSYYTLRCTTDDGSSMSAVGHSILCPCQPLDSNFLVSYWIIRGPRTQHPGFSKTVRKFRNLRLDSRSYFCCLFCCLPLLSFPYTQESQSRKLSETAPSLLIFQSPAHRIVGHPSLGLTMVLSSNFPTNDGREDEVDAPARLHQNHSK